MEIELSHRADVVLRHLPKKDARSVGKRLNVLQSSGFLGFKNAHPRHLTMRGSEEVFVFPASPEFRFVFTRDKTAPDGKIQIIDIVDQSRIESFEQREIHGDEARKPSSRRKASPSSTSTEDRSDSDAQ